MEIASINSANKKTNSSPFNKSFITNLIALTLTIGGYYSPVYSQYIFGIGIFALSGAITNWLAIYMLFEKVPLLYGSGVIPSRFEEFKLGIKNLIMGQFFTKENIEKFLLAQSSEQVSSPLNLDPILASINYDQIFDKLTQVILNSSFGGMLAMFGGPAALQPLRLPFQEKMKESIKEIASSESFQKSLHNQISQSLHSMPEALIPKIEHIVQRRLDELTPLMVKNIIQEMIREHLGWLVIWGGVFGGLIGFLTSFI